MFGWLEVEWIQTMAIIELESQRSKVVKGFDHTCRLCSLFSTKALLELSNLLVEQGVVSLGEAGRSLVRLDEAG